MPTTSPNPRRVLFPLGLAVALSLFGDLTLYAVLVTQLDAVGLSLGSVGIMLGVNRLVRIPGNPISGLLHDRFGRRTLFVLGMTFGVISNAGYVLFHGFWPFLAMRLLWGMAWTLINVGAMAMLLDISTPTNRGRLIGLYNIWLLAGLGFGPLIGAFLVDAYGFEAGMIACAAIGAIGLLVALLALPETMPRNGRAQNDGGETGSWSSQVGSALRRRLRAGNGDRGLVTANLIFLITMFAGEGVILSTISLLLQQRFGDTLVFAGLTVGVASAAGLILGMRSLLAGATGPLAGHLSDARVGRWPLIAASLILGSAGLLILTLADSLALVLVGVAVTAISGGATAAILTALVGDLSPPGRQGLTMGAYATFGDIGSAAGPFLAFALVSFVNLQWIYALCVVVFGVGLFLIRALSVPSQKIGERPPSPNSGGVSSPQCWGVRGANVGCSPKILRKYR